MPVFDLFRSTNSIGHAPEPDLAPAAAPGRLPPGRPAPGTGPGIPVSGPAIAAAPASGARTDPPGIQAHYYIENAGKERRYYKDLEGKQLAFRADGKAVTTKQEDRATISHMLDVAQSRGWTSLHVRGTAAFKQEAWIEAQARGLAVRGYEPSADDRRNVQARRDARAQRAEAEPGARVQPARENTLTNTSQPQQHQAQAVQPAQPTTPVPAPAPAASAAIQQVADSPAQHQAAEGSQRPGRKADGAAKAAEPGADAGQPAGRTGEAKHDAPAVQAGDEPAQKQEYPRQAREPWMHETDGYAALSPAQQASAGRSHERWTAAGTLEKPHTMDLEEYVGHAQEKQAEVREKESRLKARAGDAKPKGETEAVPSSSAPAAKALAEKVPAEKAAGEKAAVEKDAAEAARLSPNGQRVLAYIEKHISTKMAKLTDDEKADLRAHAIQAIAKREEVGPVQLPAVEADRKQQAAVTTKRKVRDGGGEQKLAQIQQPRMGMG